MIITLMMALFTVVGFIMYKFDKYGDFDIFGVIISTISSIALIICIIIITMTHTYAGKIIYSNKLYYDGLCKRLEISKSDYEDVSKSQVIADVTVWNMDVYNTKYWTESPWTNWFNPRDIADNMDYIPLD